MADRHHARRLFQLLRRHPVPAALEAAAGRVETHLVGGVLRDRMLGLPSRDFDAVVCGDGRAIAGRAAAALGATLVLLGGKAFAAYRVVGSLGGHPFVLDLWDREGTPLADDLARRDFTVNSFAVGLGDRPGAEPGEPIDPFGGLADLERRLLRATTVESFRGDPLRVLRLPRLLGQLPGFAAEPATLDLARAAAAGVAEVAAERVREELVLIFKSDDAHRALALLAALDVYPGLWLGAAPAAVAPAAVATAGGAVLELASLPDALAWLRRCSASANDDRDAAGAGGTGSEIDLLAARLAITFAHLPAAAGGGSRRSPVPAGAAVERFRAAGYLTRRVAERVLRLLAAGPIPAGEPARRHWLHRLGPLWTTAIAFEGAAALAHGGTAGERWRSDAAALAALVAIDPGRILHPPRLVSGEEVQQILGVAPGGLVGEALAAIERAQVEGRILTREQAIGLLADLRPEGPGPRDPSGK